MIIDSLTDLSLQFKVHGIVLNSDQKVWNTFNFTKLTTITLVDFHNDTLLCLAHEHNVRVLTRGWYIYTTLAKQILRDNYNYNCDLLINNNNNTFWQKPFHCNTSTTQVM